MSVAIDQSLIKFNDEVSPNISSMTSEVSSLVSQITAIVANNSAVKSIVESSYKSANQATIYGKFDEINAQYNNIRTFINSDLNQIITSSSTLITMITNLIQLKKEVDLAEQALNAAMAKPKRSYSSNSTSSERSEVDRYNSELEDEIRKCQEIYDKLFQDFQKKHQEALVFFAKLKGTDPALSTSNVITSIPSMLSNGITGTFTKANYNGMGYYIYVPDNVDSNLPLTVYLHGAGENSINKVTKNSLPFLLANGLQTDGIVICPVSTTGKWNSSEREKVMQLTNAVVENYSCDTNRISLAGYSNGAIASYTLAAKYDNYFSCVVPIAGEYWLSSDGIENLSHTKIWVFHGNKDVSFKMEEVEPKWKRVADAGGVIDWSVYDAGHGGKEKIMTKVFEEPVRSSVFTAGQDVSLLEWMQEQRRNI